MQGCGSGCCLPGSGSEPYEDPGNGSDPREERGFESDRQDKPGLDPTFEKFLFPYPDPD